MKTQKGIVDLLYDLAEALDLGAKALQKAASAAEIIKAGIDAWQAKEITEESNDDSNRSNQ